MRKYTGNDDGLATGERAGLRVLINQITKMYPALWNNGSWGNRSMRGKIGTLSVHATGRAVDLSFRHVPKSKLGIAKGGRLEAEKAMEFLTKNATALGLEAILDYYPIPHGRGWRCDRGTWKVYTKAEIHGSPMGDWFHVEVSPQMADDPEAMRKAFAEIAAAI